MFIDEAKICLVSGRGGDGLLSFRREKYRPKGGPSGGDGGRGGDVVLRASSRVRTLYDYTRTIHWKAEPGQRGGPDLKRGRRGHHLVLKVPVGTVVKALHTQEVLADLSRAGQQVTLVRGGQGGRGNAHFKTSQRRAPRIRERGEPSEELWVKLELKLLADVGLIGCPNAGKSTLLAALTANRPKIAAYPFTTTQPNLGVAVLGELESFVMVDIPGMIEGAHQGKGLGDRFLKHVERTRVLIHVVDISGLEGRDPLDDFEMINGELANFEPQLDGRPQLVAGNKVDLMSDEQVDQMIDKFRERGIELHPISAATGRGTRALLARCHHLLQETERLLAAENETAEPPEAPRLYRPIPAHQDFSVICEESGYRLEGAALRRLARLSLEEEDAVDYLQEELERIGVFKALRREGAHDGDRVTLGEHEFEYRS